LNGRWACETASWPWGLKNLGGLRGVDPGKPLADYRPGQRVGIFTLISVSDDDPKHSTSTVGFKALRLAKRTPGLGRRLPDDFVIKMPVSRH